MCDGARGLSQARELSVTSQASSLPLALDNDNAVPPRPPPLAAVASSPFSPSSPPPSSSECKMESTVAATSTPPSTPSRNYPAQCNSDNAVETEKDDGVEENKVEDKEEEEEEEGNKEGADSLAGTAGHEEMKLPSPRTGTCAPRTGTSPQPPTGTETAAAEDAAAAAPAWALEEGKEDEEDATETRITFGSLGNGSVVASPPDGGCERVEEGNTRENWAKVDDASGGGCGSDVAGGGDEAETGGGDDDDGGRTLTYISDALRYGKLGSLKVVVLV